jgi:hypothetical protein
MQSRPLASLFTVIAGAIIGGGCANSAPEQQGGGTLTRAQVQAETRALLWTHKLGPTNQDASPYQPLSVTASKSLEERKAETLVDRSRGELRPAGDAGDLKAERLALSTDATRTPAERKAETREAVQARSLTPAGQGPDAPKR